MHATHTSTSESRCASLPDISGPVREGGERCDGEERGVVGSRGVWLGVEGCGREERGVVGSRGVWWGVEGCGGEKRGIR